MTQEEIKACLADFDSQRNNDMARNSAELLYENIMWEQRRFDIAKALLPIAYNLYFSNKDFAETVDSGVDEECPEFLQVISMYVLEQADELIKQLKEVEL